MKHRIAALLGLLTMLAALLAAPAPAAAQGATCTPPINTTDCQPAAVDLQLTDPLLVYQLNQTPHTRAATVGQVLGLAPPGGLTVVPTAITLSSGAFNSNLANAPAGTITVLTNANTTFAGTLSLATQAGCASTNNGQFQLVGSVLETAGVQPWSTAQGSYAVCVSAIQNGTTIYQSFAISGVQAPGPSQAALTYHPLYTCVTNYYVATTGSDSNAGTQASPWGTWGAAQNKSLAGPGVCVNILPGTYTVGIQPTSGGNAASPTGYMVYRCTVLNGCVNTDDGTGTGNNNGPIEFFGNGQTANFVVFDGFTFGPPKSAQPYGIGVTIFSPASTFTVHHIWLIDNIITGYGEGGIEAGYNDFLYAIHNTIYGNGALGGSCGSQGSGMSMITPLLAPGYTPVAYDYVNPMVPNLNAVGISGEPARNATLYNVFYNTALLNCPVDTDANGWIADTWTHFGIGDGDPNYEGGALVYSNVAYNNGGGGLHSFKSGRITFANNSSFNNYLDVADQASYRGSIDNNSGYSTTFINNVSLALASPALYGCQANQPPYSQYNTSFLTQPLYGLAAGGAVATALTGTVSISATSAPVASAANFPAAGNYEVAVGNELWLVTAGQGTTAWTISRAQQGTLAVAQTLVTTTLNGAITSTANQITVASDTGFVPYGIQNIIVDSEVMQVTGGQGTTTWTVTRGFAGTVPATHLNGATAATPPVIWAPDYVANNISAPGHNQSCWGNFYVEIGQNQYASGDVYYGFGSVWPSGVNLANTQPQWVDVGNESPGTQTTPPVGTNFALKPSSPATDEGQIPPYLTWQASDAGACRHELLTCP